MREFQRDLWKGALEQFYRRDPDMKLDKEHPHTTPDFMEGFETGFLIGEWSFHRDSDLAHDPACKRCLSFNQTMQEILERKH